MKVYSEWIWPLPVVLGSIEEKTSNWSNSQLKPWNPLTTNSFDYLHVMPIITPAFPALNSSSTVHLNHLNIINFEFKRAYEILNNIKSDMKDSELIKN